MAGLMLLFAKEIVDEIAGDATQPGAQFFRFAQIAQLFPGGDKDILREVLALAQAAGGAVGERADEALIPRNDLAEGIAVARKAGGDQFSIVLRNGGNHCARYHIVAYVVGKGEKVTTK